MTLLRDDILDRLARHVRTSHASRFFLNGAPGSGKSTLLRQLAKTLPKSIPRSQVFGPYSVTANELDKLPAHILEDCRAAGYLDHLPNDELPMDEVWHWIIDHGHIPRNRSFLVLVDLEQSHYIDLDALRILFSAIRALETSWDYPRIQLFFLVSGYWDHAALEQHYLNVRTSFPYNAGSNYDLWSQISFDDIRQLVSEFRRGPETSVMCRAVYEITDGHPAAARDVLDRVREGPLNLLALLNATKEAAQFGPAGQRLVEVWKRLPKSAQVVIRTLLLQRHATIVGNPYYLAQLEVAGMIRVQKLGASNYVGFRSWYGELLVRLHAEELGIPNEVVKWIDLTELVPPLVTINQEAYRLIIDIENHTRNFVAIQLQRKEREGHFLSGWAMEKVQNSSQFKDAYEQALEWQQKSARADLPTDLNPLMTYLTTRRLASIIHELATELKSDSWRDIAGAIDDLANVRDAVMHHQLVDEQALQYLYELQASIYAALSDTGFN